MTRKLFTFVLTAVLLLGMSVEAAASSTAGAIALTFPIGARYNALGEAGTALSQDVTAIWWNPGGMAFMSRRPNNRGFHFMHSKLVPDLADDIALYWIGHAEPLGRSGMLGFGFTYLDMGEQLARDEAGNDLGTFSTFAWSFTLAYGVQLSQNLGLGMGIKYYRDKLAEDNVLQDTYGGGSGDSFGVDLGVHYKLTKLRSNVALAIANLGPNIKHVDADQADYMPKKLTLGLAHSLYRSEYMGILLLTDYLVPLNKWKDNELGFGLGTDEQEFGFGAEWNYLRSLFVRFGYKNAAYGDIKDTTYGFGVDLERWVGSAATFDYASVPQAEGLSRVNRISLGFSF